MNNYFVEQIGKNYKISEYLAASNIHPRRDSDGKMVYCCPFPGHSNDSTPSFYVYDKGEVQDCFCFGCIEATEPIWTDKGLVSIGCIKVGDRVLGRDGLFHEVRATSRKQKPVVPLRLSAFKDPLLLTFDHKCIFLKKEEAIEGLPYISVRKDREGSRKERYTSKTRSLCSYGDRIRFTEAETSEIGIGDFFAFPVIPLVQRHNRYLYSEEAVRKYSKGPAQKIIHLPATVDMAYFYGLYLAEGSISGRTLRLTMNLSEVEVLEKIRGILKRETGLESSVSSIPSKNVSELICSSVDLIDQMVHFFGKGCANKKMPGEILSWDQQLQKAILEGYLEGDGNHSRQNSISVSRDLTYGLFAISIQCEHLACVSDRRISKQRDESIRKDAWIITHRRRQGLNAFYENVGETRYFFSRVDSIGMPGDPVDVIDIAVLKSESFVTKLGMVHNCKLGGGIIQVVAAMERISIKDAISKLSNGLDIDMSDVIDHMVREIILATGGEDNSAETVLQMVMYISTICHDYLTRVNFDSAEIVVCDKLSMLCDNLMKSRDRKALEEIIELVPSHLGRRYEKWADKKEAEERDNLLIWQV